jgi:hypothetical protein
MGNRGGALHNERREIVRSFKNQRWITCLLEFRGRHRSVMTPGRYTELFFLDEAVAFAAGHRPCAECRHERFKAFQQAWHRPDAAASEIDAELRRTRLRYEAALNTLPNGTFVEMDGSAHLVWGDGLFLWAPERYAGRQRRPPHLTVTVLTPEPIVQCFRQGYEVEVALRQATQLP